MKKLLLISASLTISICSIIAQNRFITRGEPGELYMNNLWYVVYHWSGPYIDTTRRSICRLTENGKKLTIQYDVDVFNNHMMDINAPEYINADATPGVVYNRSCYAKSDGYTYTALWVSFDYGKNWTFREELPGQRNYYSANFEGLIYRIGSWVVHGSFVSNDYGENFEKIYETAGFANEPYFEKCELFAIDHTTKSLYYTQDCAATYETIPIGAEFVSNSADVFRGGLPGEVYISSIFNDTAPSYRIFKISFSADMGQTFRHVYVSEPYHQVLDIEPIFMSDREPGVFYVIRRYYMFDYNPDGYHTKVCIEHYKDYGDTLVGIYCHDITKFYGKTCEAVTDLFSEKYSDNCVLLTWSEPESSLPVEKYHLYRNGELLSATTNTSYTDENLPAGSYEYYVVTYYEMGCVSDTSNRVIETVEIDCDAITDLSAEKISDNSILLTWTDPNDALPIEKYSVFRNDIPLTEVTDTSYLDENLPIGDYEYCLIAHYTNGCISDTSNCVIETVGVGIGEILETGKIVVYPNPTGGTLHITTVETHGRAFLQIINIEIFDVFGRTVGAINPLQKLEGCPKDGVVINISHLSTGLYFVRIQTENSVVVRKVIKN